VASFTAEIIPPTPHANSHSFDHQAHFNTEVGSEASLLPDESWIAVVCGVSKEQLEQDEDELPDNFFVAPRDVYMPDLTAVANVLLGKLVRLVPASHIFEIRG